MLKKYVRQLKPIQENYVAPLDKILLSEAKTGGATYEVGIIMGWHNIVGKKYNQSDAQVSNKNQKKVKVLMSKIFKFMIIQLLKKQYDIK